MSVRKRVRLPIIFGCLCTVVALAMPCNSIANPGNRSYKVLEDIAGMKINAGNDFVAPFSLSASTSFKLNATIVSGAPTSFQWRQLTGNSTVGFSNSTMLQPTVTNVKISGYYQFELLAKQGTEESKDTVTVWVRNMMEKNRDLNPVKSGKRYVLGKTQMAGVGTNEIYLPYINRQRVFGQVVRGGDTIVLAANPNNGGVWFRVTIGDFGGSPQNPVVVIPETIFKLGGAGAYFKVSTGSNWTDYTDSNIVCFAKFDGLVHRETTGNVYGFQFNGGGFYAEMVHNLELCGFSIENAGHGFQIKIGSGKDSLNAFRLFDHFRMNNIHIHDVYMRNLAYEAFYIGNTDIAGNLQSGNDGPVPIGDSLIIDRIVLDSIKQDGVQISNYGTNNIVRNVLAYRTGAGNIASHNWSIVLGGNTQGRIYENVIVNAKGPAGTLGVGRVDIYNNIMDSISSGSASEAQVYVSQSQSGMKPPIQPLQVFNYQNIYTRIAPHSAVFHANYSSNMLPGAIQNNILVDPTRTLSNLIKSSANDRIQNNTLLKAINLDTSRLSWLPAWKMLKMVKANPGKKVSFFDLVEQPQGQIQIGINDNKDLLIQLPVNSVSLNANLNREAANATFQWRQESGPSAADIITPNQKNTVINELKEGNYVFTLSAFEAGTMVGTSTIRIQVAPSLK